MNVTVSNMGEPAYFAWLNLNFSSIFSFVGRADDVTDILCDLIEDTSIHCNLGNPYLQRTETLMFKLVPQYSAQMPADVMFTTNISTTSDNIVQERDENGIFLLTLTYKVRPRKFVYICFMTHKKKVYTFSMPHSKSFNP